MTKRLLITGATGYIGRALLARLTRDDFGSLLATTQRPTSVLPAGVEPVVIGDISTYHDWQQWLTDVDVVIHTAGRAHVLTETATDPLAEFRRINVDGTLNLAAQAEKCGVKRFIFISSIGVNGAVTHGRAFDESMSVAPHADYAISKWEAEIGLLQIAKDSAMEVVIIRPPLVYASDAPGNFSRLLRIIAKGVPLPLASVKNQRSFISLDNLVDFIVKCIDHPDAGNETFVVADGEDISTPQLIRLLSKGMGKSCRLVPAPIAFLRFGARILHREGICQQLCDSLQVDISKARNVMGWTPPLSATAGLTMAAEEYSRLKKAKSD